MLRFTLPTGRRVELSTLHIQRATLEVAGQTEGDRGPRERLIAALVRRYYGPGIPYTVRWHEGSEPYFLCIGSFVEMLGDSPDAFDLWDAVPTRVVCWFVWHIERPLVEIVEAGLAGLTPDWP